MKEHTLIISTSFTVQVLGIALGARQIDEMLMDSRNNHLESVVPNLEGMLSRHSLGARDVGHVIVDVGPGSFTGIRIGVSVARAFCQASGAGARPIGSLEALAWGVRENDVLITALKEARKGRVYAAFFRKKAGLIERTGGEYDIVLKDLLELPEFLEFAGREKVVFSGDAVVGAEPFIRRNFREPFSFRPCLCPSAADYSAAGGGHPEVSYERILPHYIRKCDAEIAGTHG